MGNNTFSDQLMELEFFLRSVARGEEELTKEKAEEIYKAIYKAQKIVQILEIRKRSLNNLRDEINNYMDEFNSIV